MLRTLLLLLAAGAAAWAQEDERMPAGDALTQEVCETIRDRVIPRIEAYTRMKFRRPVPIRVEPRDAWERKSKAKGFGGMAARHALAYYTPSFNVVTVVPWVIGGYLGGTPREKTRISWIADLEPTMIHELTHAIHHQNFYTEGRLYAASLKPAGLTEEELDRSTVAFLLGEGVPELVALRTTEFPQRMHRHPRSLDGIGHYMRSYRPTGKEPYRSILLKRGYVDGLNLMHQVALRAGMRGIRAILYRPPRREVLFQPEFLPENLDDPPDPDSIFGYLAPEVLKGTEVRLAVNPGHGRYFSGAHRTHVRAPGCLLGYVAEVGSADAPHGLSRYAFFIADPDAPGGWSEAQAASLKALNPGGAKEKKVDLPLLEERVRAKLLSVSMDDKSRYLHGETGGLVVLAHESRPTSTLDERVIGALRALYIRRPTPSLYADAVAKARENMNR